MIDFLTVALVAIIWGTPAYFLAGYAARRGHSPVVFFLVSVCTSPLVAYLFAKHLPEGERPLGPPAPASPITPPAYRAPGGAPAYEPPPAPARDVSQSLAGSKPPPSPS